LASVPLKFYRCSLRLKHIRGLVIAIADAAKARKTPVSRAFTPTRRTIESGTD